MHKVPFVQEGSAGQTVGANSQVRTLADGRVVLDGRSSKLYEQFPQQLLGRRAIDDFLGLDRIKRVAVDQLGQELPADALGIEKLEADELAAKRERRAPL